MKFHKENLMKNKKEKIEKLLNQNYSLELKNNFDDIKIVDIKYKDD